ncbi:Protein of unknown function [Pyronema omphalodes CBS 100304]|uniref:Uncharacterized protein n=1 Tax=Pyronema omphalodes (strain CBS 100304) TaxID=1076935 RepID=U4L1I0_PYROM|nr:Protein of unknown function [Pyronema omphalodes CBS 100304]
MTDLFDIFSNPWCDSVSERDILSRERSTEASPTVPRTVTVAANKYDRDPASTASIASQPEHEETEELPETETGTEEDGFAKEKETAELSGNETVAKEDGFNEEEEELARQLQKELLLEEVLSDTHVLTPPGTPPREGPREPNDDEAEEERALLEFELCKLRIDAYVLEDELKEVRREKRILEVQNQDLTERILREVTESQRLREELESTKVQLRKALYLGVRARVPPHKPSKPQFGFPGPLRTKLPPVDPPPFKEYVGLQQVAFDQLAQKVTVPIKSFGEALKEAHEGRVSEKKPETFGIPVNTNTAVVPAKSIFEVQRNLPSATFYYEPHLDVGSSSLYSHISAVALYRNMSAEELRLADYQRGYRYPIAGVPAVPVPALVQPKVHFLKERGPKPEEFMQVRWRESGLLVMLNNIVFMPCYVHKSQEELRLEHYEQGWRYNG